MSEQTDNLISLLEPFGLTGEEARIYLVLLKNGSQSALSISRSLRMGRTKVYRILDKLIAKELVINQFDEIGFKFVACEPTKLELLVACRESEIAALKQSLPRVQEILERQKNYSYAGSKVLYYRGERGLSQVNWNVLRAEEGLISYEVETADLYLPHDEAEKLRKEIVEREIYTRTISNAKTIKPFTKVVGLMEKYTEIRHVDPAIMTVRADIFLYNEVFAMCHYLGNKDVFCVEIYNPTLATMQKQLFEVLWQQARSLKKPLVNETLGVI